MRPRWEYRVWGRRLDELHTGLQTFCTPTGVRTSEETYIVGALNLNVKIRFGVLDVKRLIDVQRSFQLWTPTFKGGFPLAAESIDEVLGDLLGPHSPADTQDAYGIEEFLILARNSGAIVAAASKHRHGFTHRDTILEFAEVTIDGSAVQSVAVETEDLTTAVEVAMELGIDRLPNESYPMAILHKGAT
jgi:hypothetical protein